MNKWVRKNNLYGENKEKINFAFINFFIELALEYLFRSELKLCIHILE